MIGRGHKGRVDATQGPIIEALTKHGASVQSLAGVGEGVPDLLVGLQGETYLIECKDGTKKPSQRRLTDDQERWIALWKGRPVVVLMAAGMAEDWARRILTK